RCGSGNASCRSRGLVRKPTCSRECLSRRFGWIRFTMPAAEPAKSCSFRAINPRFSPVRCGSKPMAASASSVDASPSQSLCNRIMPKPIADDYADELQTQIAAWQRKPGLRAVYHHWFARIVAELADRQPVVEIGSGCGNFKHYYPAAIATDVIASGPWIDRVLDARQLPFAEKSVGNFVMID